MSRTLSARGAALIASHEGKVNTLYNDPAGHCTIGIGHLVHRGPCNGSEPAEFKRGLSDQEVYDLFISDAGRYIDAVNRLITVPLTQNQFDALVSFTFNLGEGALEESTLRRKLNARDYAGAAQEFGKWVKADGQVLPGLVRRRKDEAELFLTPDTEDDMADLDNLHPVFRARVRNACAATGSSVYSGARSTERQRQLYNDFLAGRGNPANPPGTSWHEYGDGIPGGRWALAVDFAEPYPHGQPGLIFPIKGEPWHGQPSEIPEASRVAGAENRMPVVAPTPAPPEEDQLFSPSPIDTRHIIAAHSGLLLTATGDKPGAAVVQRPADGSLGQRWMLYGHTDGTVSFVSRLGDLALDRPSGNTAAGTALQVWTADMNPAQRWAVEELNASVRRLWAPGTNRCIDIEGRSLDDGARALLWTGKNLDENYLNQWFVFARTV